MRFLVCYFGGHLSDLLCANAIYNSVAMRSSFVYAILCDFFYLSLIFAVIHAIRPVMVVYQVLKLQYFMHILISNTSGQYKDALNLAGCLKQG